MEDEPEALYSVDTSSLIQLQGMPRRTFGTLWQRLDALADAGRFMVAEEVQREIGDDASEDPVKWLRDHPGIIVPTEVVWPTGRLVANKYTDLVDLAKPNGSADPCVIALALMERERQQSQLWQSPVLVVAQERRKRPSKVAIPDACDDYGLLCVNLQGMLDREGWDDL
jgi:Domain of unknown function (DUF4411)